MNEKLTTEQIEKIASAMREEKPHLIRLEEEIERIHDGTIELKLDVRQGVIMKMYFVETKYWFKEKTNEAPQVDSKS